jgi:glycerol-3-phosphate dehydrogenase
LLFSLAFRIRQRFVPLLMPNEPQHIVHTDVLIFGGGVAGLWLLDRLRARGYRALLIESEALGAGQTRHSQGIIHGGTKYTLGGGLSKSAHAVAAMPGRWRACLDGRGEPDLTGVRVLSPHQYLWSTAGVASRLAGLFASHAMRSRVEVVEGDARPLVFRDPAFRGRVYRLDEPVLDTASLVAALAQSHGDAILRAAWPDGVHLEHSDPPVVDLLAVDHRLRVSAHRVVFAAGAGNAALLQSIGHAAPAMQRRPLHMALVRGTLPGDLFAHCLGASANPRLTVTSHHDADGRLVWYLGGELAEQGVGRDREEQIAAARAELAQLLPWVDFGGCQWASLRIDRAEPVQPGGRRPEGVFVDEQRRVITVWPTKLALAPALADEVLARLADEDLEPHGESTLPPWPQPAMAPLPWDEEMQWS